jgi:hypothetical protein
LSFFTAVNLLASPYVLSNIHMNIKKQLLMNRFRWNFVFIVLIIH